ncbi:MAG TPA: glycosyltransferase, partial [Actinomycetes bacterium]|nr:glycosyltransferase [Actinomycetes bacterium]
MTLLDDLLTKPSALAAFHSAWALAYFHLQARYAARSRSVLRSAPHAGIYRPSVDVVVASYNETPETLGACCDALVQAGSLYGGEWNVWLVDDGSANLEELEPVYGRFRARPGWTVLTGRPHQGKRKAQDAAVREGSGELVLMIDSDTRIDPSTLQALVDQFRDGTVGAATGSIRVHNAADNWLTQLIDERYRIRFEQERAAQGFFGAVLCCAGPFSAYRRSALEPHWARYLSQEFLGRQCTSGDDIHATILVLTGDGRREHRSVYAPDATARTTVPSSLSAYFRQQVRWNRSWFRELSWMLRARRVVRSPYVLFDLLTQTLLPLG